MTKTTSGSFIVWCTAFSKYGEQLNRAEPVYEGKHVCILQVEVLHEGNGIRAYL